MRWKVWGLGALVAVAAVLAAPSGAFAAGAVVGYPNSIAATGDSITQAYDADAVYPPGERPQYSYATGTSSTVQSLYERILAQNPAVSGNAFNDSVTGQTMADLATQVGDAVSQGAAEVTILMGANDVCTSSESAMTAVSTFRSEFAAATKKLSLGLPDARIYVISIPSVYRLWQVLHTNPAAVAVWNYAQICQSMLANPTSTATADVARRAAVRKRETQFNAQLGGVCAQYVHCRFDHDVVFDYPFTAADANTLDYFHPSITGQATLASVLWTNGFDYTDATAPVSTDTITPVTGGASVTLSATDNVAVSGIEYRIGAGSYHRYTGPVTVASGRQITWRAVDVNGDIEATHTLKIS
jgi:lysophospholipase L1-like esterase